MSTSDEQELSLADELSILIHEIEQHKALVLVESDDLKQAYHAGQYRKHGYTKRQCESRMDRMNGEVLGHEYALTYLYRRLNKLEGGET